MPGLNQGQQLTPIGECGSRYDGLGLSGRRHPGNFAREAEVCLLGLSENRRPAQVLARRGEMRNADGQQERRGRQAAGPIRPERGMGRGAKPLAGGEMLGVDEGGGQTAAGQVDASR